MENALNVVDLLLRQRESHLLSSVGECPSSSYQCACSILEDVKER